MKLVHFEMKSREYMLLQERTKFFLESPLLGEKLFRASEFLFNEQPESFTEFTDREWIAGRVIGERSRPAVSNAPAPAAPE